MRKTFIYSFIFLFFSFVEIYLVLLYFKNVCGSFYYSHSIYLYYIIKLLYYLLNLWVWCFSENKFLDLFKQLHDIFNRRKLLIHLIFYSRIAHNLSKKIILPWLYLLKTCKTLNIMTILFTEKLILSINFFSKYFFLRLKKLHLNILLYVCITCII